MTQVTDRINDEVKQVYRLSRVVKTLNDTVLHLEKQYPSTSRDGHCKLDHAIASLRTRIDVLENTIKLIESGQYSKVTEEVR